MNYVAGFSGVSCFYSDRMNRMAGENFNNYTKPFFQGIYNAITGFFSLITGNWQLIIVGAIGVIVLFQLIKR